MPCCSAGRPPSARPRLPSTSRRARCARLVLGPLSSREIVRFLDERAIADPPTAARLARLSSGRPGVAIALARAPEAVAARAELSRQLIDLLRARPAARLAAMRD